MLAPSLSIISSLLNLYVLILLLRVVIDLVSAFVRNWRPKGLVLILANVVYTLTDPPLKALRRVIPPLGIGGVGIDMAFLALYFIIYVAQNIIGMLFRAVY